MAAEVSLQHNRIVQHHLEPGEQILWVGQPNRWRFARNMLLNVAVGLPVTAILVYLAWHLPGFERPGRLPFFLPLAPLALLLGPGLLVSPLIGLFMARKVIYLLTDRRALILTGSRKTDSFPPSQLQGLTCTINRDRSGDVIFERRFRSKRRNRISFVDVGFLGIPKVRDVEQLVQQVAQTAAEPEPPAAPYTDGPGDLSAPPEGFTIVEGDPNVRTILHKRRGMGCMNVFLGVWLAGWTPACLWLLHAYLNNGRMEDGDPIPFWFVIPFWVAEVFVACLFAYSLFCRITIRMERDALAIETIVLVVRWGKAIPRKAIRRLVQVKDGGEGDDSFPSWGLSLEAPKTLKILRRLPYEHSHWLGQVLARWAGVEFEECPPPDP